MVSTNGSKTPECATMNGDSKGKIGCTVDKIVHSTWIGACILVSKLFSTTFTTFDSISSSANAAIASIGHRLRFNRKANRV